MTDSQPPIQTEAEITLDELVAYWGAQRASNVGQETLNRLEELRRARAQLDELRAQIEAMHAEHREEMNRTIREAREDIAEAVDNARVDAWENRDAF